MEEDLTIEDVLALAQEKAKEVDEARVYYTLRKMRLRFIRSSAVKVVKYAVALMELGLPITAPPHDNHTQKSRQISVGSTPQLRRQTRLGVEKA
jgi:hypothetical protein